MPERDKQFVFVVRDGKAYRTEITIGRRRPGEIEVLQGFKIGDEVITDGTQKVRDGMPVDLLVEGAAASLLRQGEVRWVVVGADRVAANGDFANKIGTYGLAVLARHHGVPFMVVAPTSTVDLEVPDGSAIPIEARSPDEVVWITNSQAWVPGVYMYYKQPDPEIRRKIILYLKANP